MSLGSPFITDLVPSVMNGATAPSTATTLKTAYGAGNVWNPTANFSVTFNGQHYSFTRNIPAVIDAKLLTYLQSISAPIVAA